VPGGASAAVLSSIFAPAGAPADAIRTLSLLVLGIAAAIFLLVGGLLAYCCMRYRSRPGDDEQEPPQVYGSNPVELAWTVVPILIVFVLITTTARTIYEIQAATPPADAVHVRVVGHQWWWEFQYPELGVVTANELHVPARVATYLTLESADVAHSFWVPRLAGKTDVIPNRRNVMWLTPWEPGTYLGQCAEFCGTQHAHMLLRVVAHPPDEFQRWVVSQRQPAATDSRAASGRQLFEATACVSCHTVQGTDASGTFGPDLTHLMSRETLGAGVAKNAPSTLKAWVANPSALKPGVLMPAMKLSEPELDQVVAYLTTLH
jgi:cytochrome c oxidase subunit 2